MAKKESLHPFIHRMLWMLIRAIALLGVALGMFTTFKCAGEGSWYQAGGGLLVMLLGLLLERYHLRLLNGYLPPRCPECGEVMDTREKLWEVPDDSPQWYMEYACRSCQLHYTNDVLGKAMFGWPPRNPYTPPEQAPFTLADGLKTAIAVLVAVGLIALLYWAGLA
ncbi:MAG: hypothetical protein OEL83_18885 [Desulforhopalus sp.]|nr:hypothetical protein [Desulforhopalus sp.]